MKIRSIEINGLWNRYDINWKLNSKVNILTGSNGSGKSTIMDAVRMLISEDTLLENKTNGVEINFDDNSVYGAIHFNDNLKELERRKSSNTYYKLMWTKAQKDLEKKKTNRNLEDINLEASLRIAIQKGRPISPQKLLKQIKVDFIRTFDIPLPSTIVSSKLDSFRADGVQTELDLQLHELQTKYAFYLANLADIVEKMLKKDPSAITVAYVTELYHYKNLFTRIINSAFEETGKEMILHEGRLGFVIKGTDTILSLYQLSAGEKQLLHIFMTVLMELGQDYILIMDEPEISLHIDWQEKLIKNIRKLNPNCQIIIATHAPSLLLDGWQGHVTQIEAIKKLQ